MLPHQSYGIKIVLFCHFMPHVYSSFAQLQRHLYSTEKKHNFYGLWSTAASKREQNKHFGFLDNEKIEFDYIKNLGVLLSIWLASQLVKSAKKCMNCFSVNLKFIFFLSWLDQQQKVILFQSFLKHPGYTQRTFTGLNGVLIHWGNDF